MKASLPQTSDDAAATSNTDRDVAAGENFIGLSVLFALVLEVTGNTILICCVGIVTE